ncbi:tRNA (adenosine(37)-N6)-threonylcarbamoyltransferase complex ATPase subunit type 1 TsaE [Aurantiacibacter aquimixticola]|uniref:tRNA threonylcarbamoyladenosine biosynthesis protein TsaE n=1 Tax=Aurantiacibacter aquimixticola TaxID=1958945 RepID=A0A419RSB3_9SPHN|nr:tRNA (adenosine(37)-N6)-threonylcarbamoyltransferase complex ATPase subunit type 1 TsaE [Aurantiacibacter aquimixticola]RJY08644.1 tRNA (adenosine(37)-N6)-threonylcarbamoyltransferase complex ATPase subunit type 1 TsaE [Aurantiacibacter aquimixticola]
MTFDLPDLEAMRAFGERIAELLRPGDVVELSGTLGTGKTTLSRAILRAMGHEGEVPSPTFTIIESYDHLQPPVVHADFYRLAHPSEAEQLGLDDYRDGSVLLAEWPDHAGGFAHEADCLSITLEIRGQGRLAVVEGGAGWQERMP